MQHLVESYIVFHSFVYEKAIMFMKAKSSHCDGTVCDHFTILKEKKALKILLVSWNVCVYTTVIIENSNSINHKSSFSVSSAEQSWWRLHVLLKWKEKDTTGMKPVTMSINLIKEIFFKEIIYVRVCWESSWMIVRRKLEL